YPPARIGQRALGGPAGRRAQIGELFGAQVATAPGLPDRAPAGRPRKAPIAHVRAGHTGLRRLSGGRGARAATGSVSVPLAPEKRIQRVLAEAFYGRSHLALKGLPPHLAVGHNLETGLFLERDRVV